MTTNEVAVALGLTRRRVLALIKAGKLNATRHGRDWWVEQADIDSLQIDTKHRRKDEQAKDGKR